jgi:hypothetical protein
MWWEMRTRQSPGYSFHYGQADRSGGASEETKATPTSVWEATPEEVRSRLRAARRVYDNGAADGDLKKQRTGVLLALETAYASATRELPDGADLVKPLLDLHAALQQIDESKKTPNLFNRAPLKQRDRPREMALAIACAVVTNIVEETGGELEALKHVAKKMGEDVGPFRSLRKQVMAGRKRPEAHALYSNVLKQLRNDPDRLKAGDLVLDAYCQRKWRRDEPKGGS